MKSRRLNLTLLASLLATVAAVCLLAVAFHFLFGQAAPPEQTISELRLTTDTQLEPRLRTLTRRDDNQSLEVVTLACTHERAALRQAARQILSEKLDRWSLLPPAEASRRAATLARHLRTHAGQIPDDSQPFATDVVTRLLLVPDSSTRDVNADPLVDDCVAALRSLGDRKRSAAIPSTNVSSPVTPAPVTPAPVTPAPDGSLAPSRSETDLGSTRTAGQAPARK